MHAMTTDLVTLLARSYLFCELLIDCISILGFSHFCTVSLSKPLGWGRIKKEEEEE